jgi:hypothetical protein
MGTGGKKATGGIGILGMTLVFLDHFNGPWVYCFHRYKHTKDPLIVQALKTE